MPRTHLDFQDWLMLVDLEIQKLSGGQFGENDLPDWNSRRSFDNGDSPSRGAKKALKEAEAEYGIGSW
jgi:hypothetical protein